MQTECEMPSDSEVKWMGMAESIKYVISIKGKYMGKHVA